LPSSPVGRGKGRADLVRDLKVFAGAHDGHHDGGVRRGHGRVPGGFVVGDLAAETGIEAVRLTKVLAPSAIVLDLEMPGMNGDEGMEVPAELALFKFARQKSKLAGTIRGSYSSSRVRTDPVVGDTSHRDLEWRDRGEVDREPSASSPVALAVGLSARQKGPLPLPVGLQAALSVVNDTSHRYLGWRDRRDIDREPSASAVFA
jgi:hypothetical protein